MNERDQPDETREESDDVLGADHGVARVARIEATNDVDPTQIAHS